MLHIKSYVEWHYTTPPPLPPSLSLSESVCVARFVEDAMDRIVSACVGIEVESDSGSGSGSGSESGQLPLALRAKLLMMTFSFGSPSIWHWPKKGKKRAKCAKKD